MNPSSLPITKRAPRGRTGILLAAGALVLLGAVTSATKAFQATLAENGGPTMGASESEPTIALGDEYSIESPSNGVQMFAPEASAIDIVNADGKSTKKVFVSFSRGDDVATLDGFSDMKVSYDGGRSFREYIENSVGAWMGPLNDGSLIAIEFIPAWENSSHKSVLLKFEISNDMGKTWRKQTGQFVPPAGFSFGEKAFNRGLRTNGEPLILNDGTILQEAYTQYEGDAFNRAILLESRDKGRHWSQRSTIVAPTETQGANEAGISRTIDGRLTAVLRTAGGSHQMLQVWSSDEGRTWTSPALLKADEGINTEGINPHMVLQPNGILVLSFGRPDNHVLVSYDGTGAQWHNYKLVFGNPPEMAGAARNHGSSGNTGMVSLSSSRNLIVGDACAASWGCKQYDQLYRIWARPVEAVQPGIGKIDLATKVQSGLVKLTGSFAKPNKAFPESRPQGAVDGSSALQSAAFLTGAQPQFTIALDHAYSLNRLGLMLARGEASDADVQLSLDGKTWSSPVLRARRRVDWSLRYTDFAPQSARFVRVSAPAGGTLRAVSEIELYSDTLSFENDPLYAAPRGFTDVQNARVTDVRFGGYQSARSLYLLDYSVNSPAQATRLVPASPQQRAEFEFAVGDFRSPFVISVHGEGDNGALVTPWQFRLASATKPDRTSVGVFDGEKWNDIGALKAPLALGTWVPVSLDASTDSAILTVGGESFRTTTPPQSTRALRGVTFASSGAAAYGGEFFIDDLKISSGARQ